MLDQLFKNEDLRERLLAGPMGPYLEVLASRLHELGYCHSQAQKLVRTASSLGLWLAERGLTPADAGKADLKQYLATQRRTPKGRVTEGTVGFSRLPALLASEGVLCKAGRTCAWRSVARSVSKVLDNRSRHNTLNERAISSPPRFLCCRIVRGQRTGLVTVESGEYVTNFVINKTAVARREASNRNRGPRVSPLPGGRRYRATSDRTSDPQDTALAIRGSSKALVC